MPKKLTQKKMAVVTVTTEAFVPGTLVMFYSFLKQHARFNGDFVIIHDNLDTAFKNYLRPLGKVCFLQVSDELNTQLTELLSNSPHLTQKRAHFYAIETFRLTNYDKILFCDSDLLFRQSINDLLRMKQPLVACGDGPTCRKNYRNFDSFQPVVCANSNAQEILKNTFNSGMLLLNDGMLSSEHYQALLVMLKEIWQQPHRTKLSDQFLLNRYFSGRQYLVPSTYNYLLRHRKAIEQHQGLHFSDAKVVHFNHQKPWVDQQLMQLAFDDIVLLAIFKEWQETYLECLQYLSMKQLRVSAI